MSGDKNGRFHISSIVLISLVAIVLIALCVHMKILLTHGLISDEAVYTYTAYAISKGIVPYKEMYLAQPPLMYYMLAAFIKLFGPQLVLLRFTNILIFLGTVIELFLLSNLLLKNVPSRWRESLSLLSAAVYALYPSYFLFIHVEVPLDNTLSFFALSSVLVYVLSYPSRNKKLLLLAGLLMGVTAMVCFRALFFIAPIFLFHLIDGIWKKRGKSLFSELGVMFLGMSIPIAFTLLYLFLFLGAYQQFYMQNIFFQSVRPADSLDARISAISIYVEFMLPLIVTGIVGTIYCAKRASVERDLPFLLLPLVYFFGFFSICIFTNTTSKHYFYYLTPCLVFISCMALPLISKYLFGTARRKVIIMIFLILLGVACQRTLAGGYSHTIPWFKEELTDYLDMNYYVGKYVANLTDVTDRIWTSEGAIAFFAERLIVAPNSTDFPFHAFFEFELLFSSSYSDTYRSDKAGNVSYVSTISQFVDSWESNNVKVIVFIKGSHYLILSYPDNLLWSGFDGQKGVSDYIQSKYELRCRVTSNEIPYIYEVWIRR